MFSWASKPQQATIIEVNASAKPSEVVAAVIGGSQTGSARSNPNRSMQAAFLFVVVFALVVYFREEIWSVSRDVSKHPILGASEQNQIHHYLGTQWLFGSGKEITQEDVEVAKMVEEVEKVEEKEKEQEKEQEKEKEEKQEKQEEKEKGAQKEGGEKAEKAAEKGEKDKGDKTTAAPAAAPAAATTEAKAKQAASADAPKEAKEVKEKGKDRRIRRRTLIGTRVF